MSFLKKLCRFNPTSDVYKSKCTNLVTKRKGMCCIEKDLEFINSAVNIYNNRTSNMSDDKELDDMREFISGKNLDKNNVHIDNGTRNGIVLSAMIEDFVPSPMVKVQYSINSFSITNLDRYVMKNYDCDMFLNNIYNFQVPSGKNVSIDGTDSSSVSLENHPLFSLSYFEEDKQTELLEYFIMRDSNVKILTNVTTDILQIKEFSNIDVENSMNVILESVFLIDGDYSYKLTSTRLSGEDFEKILSVSNSDWRIDFSVKNDIGGFYMTLMCSEKSHQLDTINKPYSIIEKKAMNVISLEEVSGKDFLDESESNMVIIEPNGSLSLIDTSSIDFESVFFECKSISNSALLWPSPDNVISNVPLLNGKKFGSWGYHPVKTLKSAIKNGNRVLQSTIDRRAASITSRGALIQAEDLMSASHCQAGQDDNIMNHRSVNFV